MLHLATGFTATVISTPNLQARPVAQPETERNVRLHRVAGSCAKTGDRQEGPTE